MGASQRHIGAAAPDVQNNAAIQNLAAQKAELEAKLQEDRQRYTDNYPTVRETAAKIQQLDGAIGTLANNVKASFEGGTKPPPSRSSNSGARLPGCAEQRWRNENAPLALTLFSAK